MIIASLFLYIYPWYDNGDREKCQKAISGLRWRILEHAIAFAGGHIALFMKTWSIKITAVSLKLSQTRVFVSPMSPKNTEKREKREREREREKKG